MNAAVQSVEDAGAFADASELASNLLKLLGHFSTREGGLPLHIAMAFAKNPRRMEFALNRPEQVWRLARRDASLEEVETFMETVDNNRVRRDPEAPKGRSHEGDRIYAWLDRESRNKHILELEMRDLIIRNIGHRQLTQAAKQNAKETVGLIEVIIRIATNDPNPALRDPEFIATRLARTAQERKSLKNFSQELQNPFWKKEEGRPSGGQLFEAAIQHLIEICEIAETEAKEALERGTGKRMHPHIGHVASEVKSELNHANLSLKQIRKWSKGHQRSKEAIEEMRNAQLIGAEWDSPPGWDAWLTHPDGARKHPGLRPVLNGRETYQISEANHHCLYRDYTEAKKYHLFTYPMKGSDPVKPGDACVTIALEPRAYQVSEHNKNQKTEEGVVMRIQSVYGKSNQPIPKAHPVWKAIQDLEPILDEAAEGLTEEQVLREIRYPEGPAPEEGEPLSAKQEYEATRSHMPKAARRIAESYIQIVEAAQRFENQAQNIEDAIRWTEQSEIWKDGVETEPPSTAQIARSLGNHLIPKRQVASEIFRLFAKSQHYRLRNYAHERSHHITIACEMIGLRGEEAENFFKGCLKENEGILIEKDEMTRTEFRQHLIRLLQRDHPKEYKVWKKRQKLGTKAQTAEIADSGPQI